MKRRLKGTGGNLESRAHNRSYLHRCRLFYRFGRVRDTVLGLAQPDLIDPVRGLARLNANRVISGVLQYNGDGIIRITRPAVDACRVDIEPVPHPRTLGPGPDLIIHLHPD